MRTYINLCLSGSGVDVEGLFCATVIQYEARLRRLSNEVLRQRTITATNKDLLN